MKTQTEIKLEIKNLGYQRKTWEVSLINWLQDIKDRITEGKVQEMDSSVRENAKSNPPQKKSRHKHPRNLGNYEKNKLANQIIEWEKKNLSKVQNII